MNNSIRWNAKLIFIILLGSFLYLCNFSCYSQPGQWTWMHGSNTPNNSGNYGVQGIPSPNNEPPAVYEPCEWTDLNGNFWFYGGVEPGGLALNDLWKYDPQANEWTWIAGTHTLSDPGNFGIRGAPSVNNHPPGLGWGITSWTDLNGDLWLFGGDAYNDLWKYNIASNQWTWMKGSGVTNSIGIYGTRTIPDTANNPPFRYENSTSWTDNSGNLWFFGGLGAGYSNNDLWRYSIASNTWTWMKGSNQLSQQGTWGNKGVEYSLNVPSARSSYSHWVDNSGNFWMFGGDGFDVNGSFDYLQDLWKYNPLTNNWTWMNGSNIVSSSLGNFGTRCISDSLNEPPGRTESRAVWKDSTGNFWIFGGGITGFDNCFSDLWKYCVSTNTWVWISGDSIMNMNGSYGILGVSSITNQPTARIGSVGWRDNNGHLFLFGGGHYIGNSFFEFNDLWKFEIDTACAPCIQAGQTPVPSFTVNTSSFCAGSCVSFTNLSQYASTYQWSFPGGIPYSDTTANPSPVCYNNSGNFSVTLIAANNFGSNSVTTNNMITVFPAVQFSPIVQNGDTLFSVPGYSTYQWYHDTILIPGAVNYYFIATQNGDYTIQVTDSNGCFASATLIGVITNIYENSIKQINFDAHYFSGYIYINFMSRISSLVMIELYNSTGQKIYSSNADADAGKNEIVLQGMNLSKGIYFVRVFNEKGAGVKKIVVE